MPIPTPFHERTAPLCTSLFYKDWAGYHAVRSFDTCHEREYYALRHAAGAIDVSPLFKYEVRGPDAAAFLRRVLARDVGRLRVGQVAYLCWCDDDGFVIDDGTVTRLDETHYRVTSTDPDFHWFQRHAPGHRVELEDSSDRIAVLSVQGPRSGAILEDATAGATSGLRFFRATRACIAGVDALVTRTGYTGDLGYEIWVDRGDAVALWDAVMEAGRPHGLEPAGLDAMDVTRIEAGFILNGVDYFNALHAMTRERKSTPDELGLGWSVHLDRGPFVGRDALREQRRKGPRRMLVGLEIDVEAIEAAFAEHGLPPEIPSGGWRTGVPVYDLDGEWIGQATSGAWSPLLKKSLALATIDARHAATGTRVLFETTVEYRRRTVPAVVVAKPFYDPPWKRA